jgi:zinc transporter ZupT
MDITLLKILVTAATFVIAVIGIFASYKLRKFTKWFDILSSFSGGILIATAYTHMLPEANEAYQMYMSPDTHDHSHGSPSLAPTPAGMGLKADEDGIELVFENNSTNATNGVHHHSEHNHNSHGHGHHHSHSHHAHGGNRRLLDEHKHDDHNHHHYYPLIPFLAALSFLVLFLVERGAILYMQNKKNHTKDDHSHGEIVKVDMESCHGGSSLCGADTSGAADHDGHNHHHHESSAPNCCKDIKSMEKMSEVAAFALIIAVSLHAVVEGMGMGAQRSQSLVVSSFIGVGVHKGLEGFAVGANLLEANVTKRKFIMYSAVVCLASPIGALIGYLLTLGGQTGSPGLAGAILGALAVGTFIQVATMEFLPRTFAKPDNFVLKALGLMIGFAAMSTMPLWNEHSHDH